MFSRSISAIVLISLSGCAKGNFSDIDAMLKKKTMSLAEAQAIAKSAKVSCGEYNGECNLSVGMLTIASPSEAGACTASLISPDIAVTNSHCIPNDLKSAGSNCKNRIWLNFPEQKGFETQIACSQVLEVSDISGEDTLSEDIAFIQLESPSKRPSLLVNRSGFTDNEVYKLNKVNPVFSANSVKGILGTENCRSLQGTEYTKSNDPKSRVSAFADCKVVHGNSGGPILDRNNAIHGVVQAFIKLDIVEKNILSSGGEITEQLSEVNIGTNLSCKNLPIHAGPIDGSCASLTTKVQFSLTPPNERERATSFYSNLTGILRHFDWNLRYDAEKSTLLGTPKCINTKITGDISSSVDLPIYQVKSGYDRYLRKKALLKKNVSGQADLSIKQISYQEHQVDMSISRYNDPKSSYFSGVVGYCHY